MLGTDQNVQNIQGKQENCPLCTVFTCYGYTFQNQHLNEIRWKQNMPVSSVLAVMITQQRTPWGRAFLPRVTAAAATLAVALKVKEQPLLVLAVPPQSSCDSISDILPQYLFSLQRRSVCYSALLGHGTAFSNKNSIF